jgi:hypothetical protein
MRTAGFSALRLHRWLAQGGPLEIAGGTTSSAAEAECRSLGALGLLGHACRAWSGREGT